MQLVTGIKVRVIRTLNRSTNSSFLNYSIVLESEYFNSKKCTSINATTLCLTRTNGFLNQQFWTAQ